ncbi:MULTISPECIES: Smr/MutS family protein [unclassified Candidatus Cardinium]|uniref:Smr/MutS family protein n=1 Tax=unclassified Candidatus Cardinium TaxID=2641185 RepID=UPI001FB3A3C3|nr:MULTISPECIES: Smr/MutS family protein [unclassified Candidatus Cardinium]
MESTIAIGSYVQLKDHPTIGEVVRISLDKKVLVAVGMLHFYLPLHAIELVKSPSPIAKTAAKRNNFSRGKPSKKTDPVLDLHGLNKAQALLLLEKFLDRALLLGHSRLKIIHGQGMGILRHAIRKYLNKHPLVKEVIGESPIDCMAGMTIAQL